MKTKNSILAVSMLSLSAAALWGQPAITIYNNNFGVVRDTVPLDLQKGLNQVDYTGATSQLEPTSVVLRDPSGKVKLSLVEQSYRGDPVDQRRLLQMFEGQTIRFSVVQGDVEKIVSGKIVRAPSDSAREPIIEVDGELRTSLPGTPLFPSLGDSSVLKPTLNWTLFSAEAAKLDAQLSYLTGGLSWVADYNLVMAEKGDDVVLTGLVSLTNRTGKLFEDAKIKLVAGDVNYIPPQKVSRNGSNPFGAMVMAASMDSAPQVEAKKFDEFHMYTLPLATTLFDQETKQVEFVNSPKVETKRIYVYDPTGSNGVWSIGPRVIESNGNIATGNTTVSVYREFENDKDNGLGVALPAGKMRFYRADSDGQLEFVGENHIGHTPQDETIRLRLGNAFDIVGERTRTNFYKHPSQNLIRESFEIEIRNRSDEAVTVEAIEPLYRWSNWKITENSQEYKKLNAQVIEFPVSVEAGKTAKVTYTVEYSW